MTYINHHFCVFYLIRVDILRRQLMKHLDSLWGARPTWWPLPTREYDKLYICMQGGVRRRAGNISVVLSLVVILCHAHEKIQFDRSTCQSSTCKIRLPSKYTYISHYISLIAQTTLTFPSIHIFILYALNSINNSAGMCIWSSPSLVEERTCVQESHSAVKSVTFSAPTRATFYTSCVNR